MPILPFTRFGKAITTKRAVTAGPTGESSKGSAVTSTADDASAINFSASKRTSRSSSGGVLKKCILAGLAAVTLATALAPPATAQVLCIQSPCNFEQTVPAADHSNRNGVGEFTIFRDGQGNVGVNLGTDNNQNFAPQTMNLVEAPNSDNYTLEYQSGETLCQQAVEESPPNTVNCHGPNDVTMSTPDGLIRLTGDSAGQSMTMTNSWGDSAHLFQTNDGVAGYAPHGEVVSYDGGVAFIR